MKEKHLLSRQSQTTESGSGVLGFVGGLGLGAAIMYVLDPDRGNRRRAMAQQKLFRLAHLTVDTVEKGVRDLEHRAEGVIAEARCMVRRERVPDVVIEQRVRTKLGRVACHPSSIDVTASAGHVILSGPVLRGEAEHIARAVRHVRGVRGVEARLEEHDSSENIPGLQGHCERPGDKPELLQENWAPGTRLVMGGLGLALILRAFRKPGFLNTVAGVLGLALVTRSGRHTRIVDTLMDTMRPAPGSHSGHHEQHTQTSTTSSEARRDVVGPTGIYPATGPFPPGPAEVRTAGSFGSSSYDEHGTSEMTYTGDTVLGALAGEPERGPRASSSLEELLNSDEIPRDRWLDFFNTLDKGLHGEPVTVELREGGETRVAQRDVPIDGFGADVKARELVINVGVGRTKDDLVIHTVSAKRVAVRDEGDSRVLEIESSDNRVIAVRFLKRDLQPKRVVA